MKHAAALGIIAIAGLTYVSPSAQTSTTQTSSAAGPAFEVASVKPNTDPSPAMRGVNMPADRFEGMATSVRDLIALAYGEPGTPPLVLNNTRISGGPSWINTDWFDIHAKTPSGVPVGNAGNGQKMLMLRTLLADRFKLAVHHETRELPFYALMLARADGRMGSQMRQSAVDCAALLSAGAPPPPPEPGKTPPCVIQVGMDRMTVAGQTMLTVTNVLARVTGRLIIDRTGLNGPFNFELQFSRDGLPGLPPGNLPPGVAAPPANNDLPSIFTALQEQLGLKLQSSTGPVDVLVIDHVEQPSPD